MYLVKSFIMCMLFRTHPHVTTFINPHLIPLYDPSSQDLGQIQPMASLWDA